MNSMRKKLLPILIIPLLTLICQHTASAYYDPGVQRWINRDPISDAGSMCFLFLRGHLGLPLSQKKRRDICPTIL